MMSEQPLSYDQHTRSDNPPDYHTDFSQTYDLWKKAVDAALKSDELGDQLALARRELSNATSILKQLKDKSSSAFQDLHKKKKNPTKLFPSKVTSRFLARKRASLDSNTSEDAERSLAEIDFRQAQRQENRQAQVVADLDDDIAQMSLKKESLDRLALGAEELWLYLSLTDEATRRVPDDQSAAMTLAVAEAESTDNSFRNASSLSADFSRAQLAASNAHRYLMNVLHCCDDLNTGGASSVLSEGFRGGVVNMLKQNSYIKAVGEGKKAQACLNESFRVLDSHRDMLPVTILADYDALRELGVEQISKIFNLLYHGNPHANTIRPLVKTLIDKQETSFSHLTNVAVWVQDMVPSYEASERQARMSRDSARAKLAEIWKGNLSPQ